MLRLDVEFMLGVYFGTSGPESTQPDWPPQPDRVFSALVAAWAARGKRAEETKALKWFEDQSTPIILSSKWAIRDAPVVYVPPNDVSGTTLDALPTRRRRQARRFPAASLQDPTATYVWPHAIPGAARLKVLSGLAKDISCVGRAASLTRCQFTASEPSNAGRERSPARRWVYPGRLEELERDYQEGRRPALGASVPRVISPPVKRAQSYFGHQWHVFADVDREPGPRLTHERAGGKSLDVRGGAIAAYAFRSALLSAFQGRPAPEIVTGHYKKGWPTYRPHLAFLPMANIGWHWSDGSLMGLALCFPRGTSDADERAVFGALRNLMDQQREGNRYLRSDVALGLPGKVTLKLSRQPQPDAYSLKPQRYGQSATTWATATPIVLDYALKADDPHLHSMRVDRRDEISECIAQACTHIGLPEPVYVGAHADSALRGSPSVVPPQAKPAWAHWGIPPAVKRTQLTHATLVFAEPVQGPIVLGAGRFYGLGLCLPLGGGLRE